MAGFRIPGLNPMLPAEVADDDELVIFDTSADETKRVAAGPTLGDLLAGIITIPPGGAFALPPGTVAAPSLIWTDDADTGLYKPTPHEIGVSIDGVRQMSVGGTGVTIEGDLNVTGDINGGEGNFDERYVQQAETFEMGGPAAASMWPRLASDGKLDASLLRNSVTSYKGQIHAELVPPPAAVNGDFYMQAVDGTTSASWGAAANLPIKAGDFLSYSTVQGWQIAQSSISPEAYVKRDGDTMNGKLVLAGNGATSTEAELRLLPLSADPSSLLNGDMWATATNFWGRIGGVTRPFMVGGGTGLFADGTIGLPSISFINDTDTGIYRPGTNTLGFVTGSAEVMRIDAAGNVGVGTNNPLNKLTVAGGSLAVADATPSLVLRNAAQSATLAMLQHTGVSVQLVNNVADQGMGFQVIGAGKFSFNKTVNVTGDVIAEGALRTRAVPNAIVEWYNGAGTTRLGYAYHSGAGFNLANEIDGNNIYATKVGAHVFVDSVAERFRIAPGLSSTLGDLSVGIATAMQPVAGRGNLSLNGTTDAVISFGNAGVIAGYIHSAATSLNFTSSGARDMMFNLNSSEKMRILGANGRVGIGTPAPITKLHVLGDGVLVESNTDANGFVSYRNTVGDWATGMLGVAGWKDWHIYNNLGGLGSAFFIASDTNRATFTKPLAVTGAGGFNIGTLGGAPRIDYASSAFNFYTSGGAGAPINAGANSNFNGDLYLRNGEFITGSNGTNKMRWFDPTLVTQRAGFSHDGATMVIKNDVAGGGLLLGAGGAYRLAIEGTGAAIYPYTDNYTKLGYGAGQRWLQIWCSDNVIQTSDAREKTPFAALTPAELAAAKTIAQGIGSYKWLESAGIDDRTHIGVTAQAVIAAMEAQGLDALLYGMVRYDEWDAVEAVEEVEDIPETRDEETGEVISEGVTGKIPVPGREAGNRYSVAYTELAMFIAAAQEQRLAEQEEAQVSLEARLAALERPRPRGPRN